ncbi:MAG: DUF4402 domain-containing protein [Rhodoferax sp.]|nr:DUF4402 domain-containing protein [Rhodoferax sp.]
MNSGKFASFKHSALKAALASALVLGGAGFGVNAYAAVATSTATSTVIAPIGITAPVVLSFGKFAPGAGGSVTISNSGARTSSGVILSSTSSVQTAARFDVTGEGSSTYAITHSGVTVLSDTATTPNTMALAKTSDLTGANVTTGNVATGTLTSGVQSIYVGGTLTVGATQVAGTYTGAVTVTVEYN